MPKYRIDPDLAFIAHCTNDDLSLLVSVLTHDHKDGKKRWSERLTRKPEYQLYYPNHQRYWTDICAELQTYGANSLVSAVRGNKGVLYREILLDVCKKLKVNFNPKSDIETLEMNLLMTVMEKSLDKLNEEELRTLAHDLQLNLTNPTPQLVMIALQAAVRTSGFAALEIATVAAMSIIELLGGVAT
ncbi:DUF3944 domain-containing protein, partial [Providencia stuartii]